MSERGPHGEDDYSCRGKIGFESLALARRVALARDKGAPGRKGGKSGDAYRCAHCGLAHIGRSRGILKLKRPRRVAEEEDDE